MDEQTRIDIRDIQGYLLNDFYEEIEINMVTLMFTIIFFPPD